MVRAILLCSLLLLALPRPVAAEWHFVPMIGVTFGKVTNFLDSAGGAQERDRHFGITVSRLGEGILGFEGGVVWTPGFFQGTDPVRRDLVETSRAISAMGNVMLTTPRLWTEYSLRPFISGGVGLLHVLAEDSAAVFPVDANLWGVNVGGGAIGFLSERTGVRFEMRYFSTLGRKELPGMTLDGNAAHLRYLTASIGVVIRR
ncbi:hypothetical protein BH23ACI1_BH23ACI1_29650 [soil metagenome]